MEALGVGEIVGTTKGNKKISTEIIPDDSRIIANINLEDNPEYRSLNVTDDKKSSDGKFEVHKDHYDASAKTVANYMPNEDNIVKNWGSMHWTKKADIIQKANTSLLSQLKAVETSPKILARIDKQIEG